MRRKYFGWAIAAIATLGPMQAWGGDREIAEQIIERLKADRDSGALKDFTLDMKVDQGVVLFRGNVSEASQKELVLNAAEGIEGIAKVVDEVDVTSAEPAAQPAIAEASGFSFREALAAQAEKLRSETAVKVSPAAKTLEVVPGEVVPTAAVEPVAEATASQDVTGAVVGALREAQLRGELKGFGVDVKNRGGVIQLVGQAGSEEQRDRIVQIAESTPGVRGVEESITIAQVNAELPRLPQPPQLEELAPVRVESAPVRQQAASAPVTTMAAPYRMQGQPTARPVSGLVQGAPVMGQPVPVGGYYGGAAAAPRYDSPYLPNYAWPGYAAYPNYAAVTYPQQYSPTAFPYIGPFYPYPQVPLGWRKVSLEWDDGWWYLDFTDR